MSQNTRRVILIGKTGNGKSSTGNSIIGERVFISGKSAHSVTQKCDVHTSTAEINRPRYQVCDTPGLLDTDAILGERTIEIQKSIIPCPEPHAFLLVFSSTSRMTMDEKYTIDLLRIIFGQQMFDHCIVVFTRGDEFDDDNEFKRFWEECPLLNVLFQKCESRFLRIENGNPENGITDDIRRLLSLIDKVSNDGKRIYRCAYLQTHIEVLKTHVKNNKDNESIEFQLKSLDNDLSEKLESSIWEMGLAATVLIGAAAIGAGSVGVLCYGTYIAGTTAVSAIASAIGPTAIAAGAAAIGSTGFRRNLFPIVIGASAAFAMIAERVSDKLKTSSDKHKKNGADVSKY